MRTVYILFVAAVVMHAVVALPNCGKFHAPSGVVYDLAPLTRPPTDPWYYNTTKGEQYYWNFCLNLIDVPIPVELLSQEATAVLISDAVYPIGHLQDYKLFEIAPGAIQLSYSVSSKVSAGKSSCPAGSSTNSSITVMCDKDTEAIVQSIEETSPCSYTITMISKYVCVGTKPSFGVATEPPTITPTTVPTTEPTTVPTTVPVQPTDIHPQAPTAESQHPNFIPGIPDSSPQNYPTSSSSSSPSHGSKTITVVLGVLFVVVAITTYRRRRARLHAQYLALQQQASHQQHSSIPVSDMQTPYYPQQPQPMYYVPQQDQPQPHYPTFIPPLHQPFYMVAPQLSQQQQQQHLRKLHQ